MADQKLSELNPIPSGGILSTDLVYVVRGNGASPEVFTSYKETIAGLFGEIFQDSVGAMAGIGEGVRLDYADAAGQLQPSLDYATLAAETVSDADFMAIQRAGSPGDHYKATLSAAIASGGGAPNSADYLVKTANAGLSAERVVTDTPSVTWDWATAGQAKAKVNESLIIAASDETTALTTGTAKVTFRMPYAFTLTDVKASVTTAPTGGTLLTVDVNESGTTILSTKLTFDASEKTTTTAATPRVISDSALADDAEITIDIDAVGSTIAGAGLKVCLIGTRA